jgi:hypothetical protein
MMYAHVALLIVYIVCTAASCYCCCCCVVHSGKLVAVTEVAAGGTALVAHTVWLYAALKEQHDSQKHWGYCCALPLLQH